jgi:hypothetical protein
MTENGRWHASWILSALFAVTCVVLPVLSTIEMTELVIAIIVLVLLGFALLWLSTPVVAHRTVKAVFTVLILALGIGSVLWTIKTDRPVLNVKAEYVLAQIQPDKSLIDVEAFVQNKGRQPAYGENWQFKIMSGPNTFVGVQKFGQKRPPDITADEPELASEDFPVGKPVRGWLYFEFQITADEMHSLFNCDSPPKNASITLSLMDTKEKKTWTQTRQFQEMIQASCTKFPTKPQTLPNPISTANF